MTSTVDKIKIIHLAVATTGSGIVNWLIENHVGWWVTFITGLLILLLTLIKVIMAIGRFYYKWKAGTLFSDKP